MNGPLGRVKILLCVSKRDTTTISFIISSYQLDIFLKKLLHLSLTREKTKVVYYVEVTPIVISLDAPEHITFDDFTY